MKKTLLLALATALTAAPAMALDFNGEAFVTFKDSSSNTDVKNAGTDVERLRLFLSHKFDDKWSFKGRISLAADTTGAKLTIPEAHFLGSSILMQDDTIKFGAQDYPANGFESAYAPRWITKTMMDNEGFVGGTITPSGFSYGMKFGAVKVTLFTLSGEAGEVTDSDDNNKVNGFAVGYKINDMFNVWLNQSTSNATGTISSKVPVATFNTKSTTLSNVGVGYNSEMVDASLSYSQSAYTVETGSAPKAKTVMGLTTMFKKIAGSKYNLYAHYWTGYDKYEDTSEDTASKYLIGPNFELADKLNMGVFYGATMYQSAYKDANPTLKDPTEISVKLAAKF